MAVESGINWAKLVDVDDALIPTYGLYGGPNYTGGRIDPATFVDVAPLDPLDALFKAHDLAYFTIPSTDTHALALADLALIGGMMALSDAQMGGEAHLYAGAAELVLLHNVVVTYGEEDLLTRNQVEAILADASDNLRQGTIDPENAAERAGVNEVLSQLPVLEAALSLEDVVSLQTFRSGSLSFLQPSTVFPAAPSASGFTLQSGSLASLVEVGTQASAVLPRASLQAGLENVGVADAQTVIGGLHVSGDLDWFF